MGISPQSIHEKQPHRPGCIRGNNVYSSHFYYIFIIFPEYVDMLIIAVKYEVLRGSLVVGCEHPMPQNFPFRVPDFLMNLLSLSLLCLILVITCIESSKEVFSSKLNVKRILDLFW